MSTAEARRNARIRKILEHSEHRLSKITGVEKKTTVTEFDGVKFGCYTSIDHSNDINGITRVDGVCKDDISSNYQSLLGNDVTDTDDRSIADMPENNMSDTKKLLNASNIIKQSKLIHILILALIQNLIFVISDFVHIDNHKTFVGNIFLPLIIYDIHYYIFNYPKASKPGFIDLLLSNYINLNMTKYLNLSVCIIQIMGDMMVYFFTFLVLFKCLTAFN